MCALVLPKYYAFSVSCLLLGIVYEQNMAYNSALSDQHSVFILGFLLLGGIRNLGDDQVKVCYIVVQVHNYVKHLNLIVAKHWLVI